MQYQEDDIQIAYENAGGSSWQDLLDYLESGPGEDLPDLGEEEIRGLIEQVRGLMEAGREYPTSSERLLEMLAERQHEAA